MVDKIFGADFTNNTNPSGNSTLSVNTGSVLEDVTLYDILKIISGLSADTTPAGADSILTWDTSASAVKQVLLNNLYIALRIPKPGDMLNGKLSVSVLSNNLTVALKTQAGVDPSTADPVYVNINGTVRQVTGALSVTKNAGSNWCNAGGAELAAKEIDYFAYLLWNTGPDPDAISIAFARISHGRVYSDFSGTTTSEKYLAFSGSTPNATDDACVIGRFAATLSAGAGYTWTVPAFTNTNLIQNPVFETRWLNWTPAFSAGGSMTITSTTIEWARYHILPLECEIDYRVGGTLGGTAHGDVRMTLPFNAERLSVSNPSVGALLWLDAGSGGAANTGGSYVLTGTPHILNIIKYNFANWALGAGLIVVGNGFYGI